MQDRIKVRSLLLQNVPIEQTYFSNYLAIVKQDIICIKFLEKVYLMTKSYTKDKTSVDEHNKRVMI